MSVRLAEETVPAQPGDIDYLKKSFLQNQGTKIFV
jgi:hypothetical protein